jgi:hypothetical protein
VYDLHKTPQNNDENSEPLLLLEVTVPSTGRIRGFSILEQTGENNLLIAITADGVISFWDILKFEKPLVVIRTEAHLTCIVSANNHPPKNKYENTVEAGEMREKGKKKLRKEPLLGKKMEKEENHKEKTESKKRKATSAIPLGRIPAKRLRKVPNEHRLRKKREKEKSKEREEREVERRSQSKERKQKAKEKKRKQKKKRE